MLRRLLIAFIITCIMLGCGASSAACININIEGIIKDIAEKYDISTVSVCLKKNGQIIRSINTSQEINRDIFCIGSISKSFVALLALQLEKDGIIKLDDTIGKYLPEIDFWNKDRVTLKDLLSMRSGIPDYLTGFDRDDYYGEYKEDELIIKGLSEFALLQKGDFIYSNTNILIACEMMEKATGKTCEELIKDKILIPLGLNDTFFDDEKNLIKDRLVKGYSDIKGSVRIDFSDTSTSWAGLACGMYSTPTDMAEWGMSLLNAPIVAQVNFLPVWDGFKYGLCVAQKQIGDKQVLVLGGNVPGYNSTVYIDGTTVISVFCSLSDYSGKNVSCSEEIANLILNEFTRS